MVLVQALMTAAPYGGGLYRPPPSVTIGSRRESSGEVLVHTCISVSENLKFHCFVNTISVYHISYKSEQISLTQSSEGLIGVAYLRGCNPQPRLSLNTVAI